VVTYVTKDGDVLDWICWRHYGSTAPATTEAVLDANYGLAEKGPVFKAGIEIELPALDTTSEIAIVNLWD